jgi:ribosomal protein L11 methyltransferase
MPVYELKRPVPPEFVSQLEDALAEQEEQRLMLLEDKPTNAAWLAGYFASPEEALRAWKTFVAATNLELGAPLPDVRQLPDADWKESYKAHFKAWRFGKLNWVPVWERETFKLPAGEQVLWLDPGMAFGTGNHETTRLVVERLVADADERGMGGAVIDAGCGSGILALSAAKLGFSTIAAFDNDPVAVQVSEENAVLNDLGGRVEFYVGDLITGLAGRSGDFVMANIQADVLIRFARELVNSVAPKGVLVLSGILARENEAVREAFRAVAPGWTMETRTMGEWSDLVLVRADP